MRAARSSLLLLAVIVGMVLFGNSLTGGAARLDHPQFESLTLLPSVPDGWGVAVQRLTLESGDTWDQSYPGPTVFYVESGVLTTAPDAVVNNKLAVLGGSAAGIDDGSPGTVPTGPEIPSGWGLYSANGAFGEIRNEEDADLELLVVLAVPEDQI